MLLPKTDNERPPLFEAVGCICRCNDKLLLLRRKKDRSFPNSWGIPSGKLQKRETVLKAMIRELFEETSILVSSDNLKLMKTYHIIGEMSFLYTVYLCDFEEFPTIKTNPKEHTRFGWFTVDDALRLNLVPDLDSCFRDVFSSLVIQQEQLELFTGLPTSIATSTVALEQRALKVAYAGHLNPNEGENHILVSFGPPCALKTTLLKAMIKRNPALTIVADNTILRRSSNLNFYLRQAFEEERRSFFFHFQMESLLLRFRYTFEAPNNSLVDESIYTSLAYSKALYRLNWLTDYEYESFYAYYNLLFTLLPKPKTLLYLDCDEPILMKRLKRRSRKHESYYTFEYVEAMRTAFKEVAHELFNEHRFDVVYIDSGKQGLGPMLDLYEFPSSS